MTSPSSSSRPVRGTLLLLVALLSTVPSAGCSFLFVDAPKRHAQTRAVTCTEGYGWPVVDTMIGIFQVARVLYAATQTDADYQGAPLPREADMGLGLAFTAVFAVAAGYGYSTVNDCNEEHDFDQRQDQRPTGPSVRRRPIPRPPKPAPPAEAEGAPTAAATTEPPPDAGASAPASPPLLKPTAPVRQRDDPE